MWAGISSTNCLFLGVRRDRQDLVCQNQGNFGEILRFVFFLIQRMIWKSSEVVTMTHWKFSGDNVIVNLNRLPSYLNRQQNKNIKTETRKYKYFD